MQAMVKFSNYIINFVNKENPMNKRLQQFLSAENISQSQFAEILGVAKASVSHIIAGRNKPGFDFIESISRHFPKLNLEWLVSGRGRMYKDAAESNSQEDTIPLETPQVPDFQDDRPKITKVVIFYENGTFKEFQ